MAWSNSVTNQLLFSISETVLISQFENSRTVSRISIQWLASLFNFPYSMGNQTLDRINLKPNFVCPKP